jgi:hypothetical protein
MNIKLEKIAEVREKKGKETLGWFGGKALRLLAIENLHNGHNNFAVVEYK